MQKEREISKWLCNSVLKYVQVMVKPTMARKKVLLSYCLWKLYKTVRSGGAACCFLGGSGLACVSLGRHMQALERSVSCGKENS